MPKDEDGSGQNDRTNNPPPFHNQDPVRDENESSTTHIQENVTNNRPHWADVVIAVFTGLILITYITSDYFLWKQQGLTRDAMEQAKRDNASSIAAQQKIAQDALVASQQSVDKSLRATIDNLHLDQRAWVGMVGIGLDAVEIDKPLYAHVVLFNSGKTVAKHVTAVNVMRFFPTKLKKLPPTNAGESKSVGVLVPGARYERKFTDAKRKVSKVDKDCITGDWYTYIWGEVKYIDIFKQHHRTLFCSYRQGAEGDFLQCPFNNDAT